MNQKEINELRRRFRPEKSAISRVYGCYVNSSKEIVSDLDESLGMMPQEESEKYLSLLKKGLSGSLGKNLIDIVFSTQQVADSEEHRLLTTLWDSQLKDNEARQTFYHKVIDSLDMGDSSYLLLLACDSYDVPHRGKDDSLQADASDEVFTYIVCVVCPIKEGKVELGYFPGDNEFHCAAGQTVASPELGFLFPAFDDRAANIYNALFYSRKANEIHQEFIDAIFHVEAPMSAVEQKEAFQSALSDAFDCSLEVMQTVHEQLREKIKEHRESGSSEPLEMSASEIGQILQSCGIADEQVAAFQEKCGYVIFFGTCFALLISGKIGVDPWLISLAGAVLMVLCGVIKGKQINDALPVSYFAVFAGALAMGGALTNTGAADLIGNMIATMANSVNSTVGVYFIIFIVTFLVTQFMLNGAVMWSLMPVILATVKVMGVNPIGAAVIIHIAATAAYSTPMSCPAIPLAMAAGGYDFKSVFKQSIIPSILMCVAGVLWISFMYPIF